MPIATIATSRSPSAAPVTAKLIHRLQQDLLRLDENRFLPRAGASVDCIRRSKTTDSFVVARGELDQAL